MPRWTRVIDGFTSSGVVSAAGNRRAIRVGQEPLDLFRRYMAVYAREQASCHFSPALIANLERNWNAQNRGDLDGSKAIDSVAKFIWSRRSLCASSNLLSKFASATWIDSTERHVASRRASTASRRATVVRRHRRRTMRLEIVHSLGEGRFDIGQCRPLRLGRLNRSVDLIDRGS